MKKKIYMAFVMSFILGTVTGCGQNAKAPENTVQTETTKGKGVVKKKIQPGTDIAELEIGLSAVRYEEMVVTETPVVTNYYLSEGEKYGIGTSQSHTRYDILSKALEEQGTMTETDVRDALDSVSKDNFGEFESTEWSIVMNQETRELTYYHRENYERGYTISVR